MRNVIEILLPQEILGFNILPAEDDILLSVKSMEGIRFNIKLLELVE